MVGFIIGMSHVQELIDRCRFRRDLCIGCRIGVQARAAVTTRSLMPDESAFTEADVINVSSRSDALQPKCARLAADRAVVSHVPQVAIDGLLSPDNERDRSPLSQPELRDFDFAIKRARREISPGAGWASATMPPRVSIKASLMKGEPRVICCVLR